ncbi:MAG: SDR family oxidoreductase [Pseudomonadota bacterium]|nr:SDR family oxidoreductase [Pseudomonadota bacterium]
MSKLVILTGSSGFLGKKISNQFSTIKDLRLIKVTSKNISRNDTFKVDFRKPESIRVFFKKIRRIYGEPSVLINNAAIITQKKFSDFISNSNDKRILNTYLINSYASLLFIKYFMLGGKKIEKPKIVINLLTRNAVFGGSRHIDYISSKASLYNATRSLSNDYKDVTFYNFLPGPFGDKKFHTNPNKIVNEIISCFSKNIGNNYREIYFENSLDIIQIILRNLFNYLKNIRNAPPK